MRRGDERGALRPVVVIAILALVGAVAVFYFRGIEEGGEAPILIPAETEVAPLIRHPLPEPEPLAESGGEEAEPLAEHLVTPLPELDHSDDALIRIIEYLADNPRLAELVVTRNLVRRLVTTIDNLTGRSVALNHLPLTPPEGRFLVTQRDEETVFLDSRDFARYGAHVALIDRLDAESLARAYVHFYPLFQEAYRELGYPQAFFNDRLIAVIDHLLETPEESGEIRLEQPSVLYQYADPLLEGRSAGQKLLLRMGPENARAVKRKLREFRQALVR